MESTALAPSCGAAAACTVDDALTGTSEFFHAVVEEWIEDPQTTIACGRWGDGAVSEMAGGSDHPDRTPAGGAPNP